MTESATLTERLTIFHAYVIATDEDGDTVRVIATVWADSARTAREAVAERFTSDGYATVRLDRLERIGSTVTDVGNGAVLVVRDY